MKVAIVADLAVEYSGSELVLDQFFSLYPMADFYCLLVVPKAVERIKQKFPGVTFFESPFQKLVKNNSVGKWMSVLKIFSWIYWELLNLNGYDLIISSAQSYMAKNVKKAKGAVHVAYIHTPPRYLYDEYCEINWVRRFPFRLLLIPLRWIDRVGAQRPDVLVANSKNVARRIKKYWQREATVVYPPVEIRPIKNRQKKDFYIFVGRLTRQKGIHLVVDCFTKYQLPLKVIGSGDEYKNLAARAGETIEFVGKCDDNKKYRLLSEAKALIFTSIEEDFGIVPVEAMACGTAVIAYNSGGVKETVVDGVTGILFDDYTVEGLREAIRRIEKLSINCQSCYNQADRFDGNKFKKEIGRLLPADTSLK